MLWLVISHQGSPFHIVPADCIAEADVAHRPQSRIVGWAQPILSARIGVAAYSV
ncbi:uncharacterized protein BDR25DRAFT_301148 [Lindgomyces ingoldianus]|uniref:Uncharacterized protein n=1 Tax=Lindgomyces ingoldianus TaxID=673940 RepID=A0ACB6RAF6_9PLEO|nr:uncharacterized protein BDR25DRAFT_301148 [Lindgomyces ingoldianus]KAF2475512.1 hypothetical protein BDR25DRAFT_301148 [Lindgomyces ingoldianus]